MPFKDFSTLGSLNDAFAPDGAPRRDHNHVDNSAGFGRSRPVSHDDPHGKLRTKPKQTILLVDDEDVVRDIAREVLEDLGYEVLEASGGEQAISLFEERKGEVDLLLSDVVMPVMHGRALYENLRRRDPELKILYMSGYTNEILGQGGILDEGTNLLPKPFTLTALARRVEEAIAHA